MDNISAAQYLRFRKLKAILMIKLLISLPFLLTTIVISGQQSKKKPTAPVFTKKIITTQFVSEGVAVADVNNDRKTDIISGAFWFESTSWTRHEITRADTFNIKSYSNAFLNFALDVNQDGWIDQIRVDHPGKPVVWFENPGNQPGHWKEREINQSLGNETPMLVDVDGDGRPDIIGNDAIAKQVIWLKSPSRKGDTVWTKIVVSTDTSFGVHKYTHGIGLG